MNERINGNPDNYKYWIPVMGKLMKELDNSVKEIGFVEAHRKIMSSIGKDKFIINGKDERLKEILKNKPTVVINNHPFYGEIFAGIAALEPRSDIYLIGTAEYLGIGPNISKHIDPIYMTKQMTAEKQKLVVKLGHGLHIDPHFSSEEAHQKNIKSIEKAAEQVKRNGLVIIMPEGIRAEKTTTWSNGIGYLLTEIGKGTNATLINSYVDGVNEYDLLRLAPGIKNLFNPITVTFSDPESIEDILDKNSDPKAITRGLKENYDEWVQSLKNKPLFRPT